MPYLVIELWSATLQLYYSNHRHYKSQLFKKLDTEVSVIQGQIEFQTGKVYEWECVSVFHGKVISESRF